MSVEAQPALDYSWLHDDLEEDLVGAEWHQSAIRALATSLKTLAEARHWPWHVGDQVTLVAWKPDNSAWRPAPDIVLYPQLGPEERQEISVREEGPPALIIEVVSASTWAYDVSLESTRRCKKQVGKAFGYLVGLRVPEYLVFDPRGEFLAGQCRAWRRVGDVVQEWHPEPDGRYHSQTLGISVQPDGARLRVIDPEGQPVPFWFEATRENMALRQRIAALEAELQQVRRLGQQDNVSEQ